MEDILIIVGFCILLIYLLILLIFKVFQFLIRSINKLFKTRKPIKTQKAFSDVKKHDVNKSPKIKTNISSSNVKTAAKDDSIIDVTGQSYKISTSNNLKKFINGIPVWKTRNISSYSEIENATNQQKKFYKIYKINFLNDIFFDLEGNSNYAFILLFDILEEFEIHKNINLLEHRLKSLGENYPEVKTFSTMFLNDEKKIFFESSSQEENTVQKHYYNDNRLGNKYRLQLDLKDDEITILNSLVDTNNKFNSILFCEFQLVTLLLGCIKVLKERYGVEKLTNIIEIILGEERNINFRLYSNTYNISSNNVVYQCVYKTCENSLRDYFKVGRKSDIQYYLKTKESVNLFNEKILIVIQDFIDSSISGIKEIDIESEIEINNYSRSRYKHKLKHLSDTFQKTKLQDYKNAIENLAKRNQGNPYIENIFYEASKFISKYDKLMSLSFYVQYIYHDLDSDNFDNKQLTKTIQKSLFKTDEQIQDFKQIINDLILDRDLEKALKSVTKIYEVKRKKIQLDKTSIKEVQQQSAGTVDLLNEYLRDDFEEENNSIQSQEISNDEIMIELTQKKEESHQSMFLNELSLNPTQISVLGLFHKNNLSVPQIDIEDFVKTKGFLKNQVIDSINETCYEILDDVLIEEEDDYYTIIPEYFEKIKAI
ncbi:MAG: hypothetical protein M9897_07585 [Brumimicrobium sp.]|nr:hypothetical protein [Brumimicrobium sp.]